MKKQNIIIAGTVAIAIILVLLKVINKKEPILTFSKDIITNSKEVILKTNEPQKETKIIEAQKELYEEKLKEYKTKKAVPKESVPQKALLTEDDMKFFNIYGGALFSHLVFENEKHKVRYAKLITPFNHNIHPWYLDQSWYKHLSEKNKLDLYDYDIETVFYSFKNAEKKGVERTILLNFLNKEDNPYAVAITYAIKTLSNITDTDYTDLFRSFLYDDDSYVRLEATKALIKTGDNDYALHFVDEYVQKEGRAELLNALIDDKGELVDDRALQVLNDGAAHKNEEVKITSLMHLMMLKKIDKQKAKKMAQNTLSNLVDKTLKDYGIGYYKDFSPHYYKIDNRSDETVDEILQDFQSDTRACGHAANILIRMKDEKSFKMIDKYLNKNTKEHVCF